MACYLQDAILGTALTNENLKTQFLFLRNHNLVFGVVVEKKISLKVKEWKREKTLKGSESVSDKMAPEIELETWTLENLTSSNLVITCGIIYTWEN